MREELWVVGLLAVGLGSGCSCSSELPERPDVQVAPAEPSGALVLSFDDHFVEEWLSVQPMLEQYGARVTFFVDRLDRISWDEKTMIIDLESAGHEIGNHGYRHIGAEEWQGTVDEYVADEIEPSKKSYRELALTVRNYAYPKGQRTASFDSALLDHFELVRGTAHRRRGDDGDWAPLEQWDDVFYPYDQNPGLVFAAGVDGRHSIPIEQIRDAFVRAAEEGSAIFLYAHRPSADNSSAANIDPDYLEQILAAAVETGLEFYRTSDFVDLASP